MHAFSKEIKENGFFSLYRGGLPYLSMFTTMISIQFTVYESYIKFMKDRDLESFQKKQPMHIVSASFLAGVIGSAATNGFEVLVVTKQTKPETKILDIIKKDKFNLLIKGLGARVYSHSLHSILFFSTVTYIGKLFNVELEE